MLNKSIKHILIEKTDRLLRNITDYALIDQLIEHSDIHIHLVKENVVLNKSSRSNEKFIFGIKALMAKNYSDNLSEEVRKGMHEKAAQGIYPSGAPYGYSNIRENGKSLIKVEPGGAVFVKKVFDLYATGAYSLKTLRKKLLTDGIVYKNGKNFYTSTLETILKNEFYIGVFYWNGKKYENASHEPLISREQFQQVQNILINRHKSKSKKGIFPYTNFIKCGICGYSLTAEIKKNKYIYYHCTGYKGNCKQPYIRQEDLENHFSNLLDQLHITSEVHDVILKTMKESLKDKIEYHTSLVEGLEQQIKVLQKRIDQCYLDKLDGKINESFWQTHTNKWIAEKEELTKKLVAAQKADSHYLENANLILELTKNASLWFQKGSPDKKRRVLDILISNCTYLDGNVDVELKPVFGLILESAKNEDWYARPESNR